MPFPFSRGSGSSASREGVSLYSRELPIRTSLSFPLNSYRNSLGRPVDYLGGQPIEWLLVE